MANSALIDDLLKQFADNPRRVFARLANEYRKRGELDSAIEICRSHVPLQPGYISGHIVLGQALYDSGALEDARSAFETALALDPENLIALRHMGDIARANGDVERARAWYRQLLEVDPQNEEVAAQIESLGAAAPTQDSAPSAASEEMGSWGEVSPEAIDLTVEEDTASGSGPAAEAAVESAASINEGTVADDALALEEVFDFPESAEGEAAAETAPVPTVEGLEATSFQGEESAEVAQVELVELEDLSPESADASRSSEDIADTSPAQGALAPLFPADTYDFTSEDGSDEHAARSDFATETMAELYLQQGFPDRALAIYRELAARDPDNVSLQERIAELTDTEDAAPAPAPGGKSARTAREFFGVLAYRHAPHAESLEVAPVTESVTESEEVEPPVAEATAEAPSAEGTAEASAVVADPMPDSPAVETRSGKPGREAASALSLDDVFRDAPTADGSGSRKGLSFDEFFARRGNGDAEHTNGSVAAAADESTTSEEHASDDEPQDLELFHAWLDGLKG